MSTAFERRDVAKALADADSLCRERGKRLTASRRAVLEVLWQTNRTMGAYDHLHQLAQTLNKRILPPTVYRALHFLVEQGFITRIESCNAFVPFANPSDPHPSVFFICARCHSSSEVENAALKRLIDRDAEALGFHIQKQVLELQGTCSHCRTVSGDCAI
jgi:Fur family zinc uptake transcriptional regulator